MHTRRSITFFLLLFYAITIWAVDNPEPSDKMIALMAEEEKIRERQRSAPIHIVEAPVADVKKQSPASDAWLWWTLAGFSLLGGSSLFIYTKKRNELPQAAHEQNTEVAGDHAPVVATPEVNPDRHFSRLAEEILQLHLEDPNFNAAAYCEAMNMSKSHFYRKFREIFQQSPAKYIRMQRLARAHSMLKQKEGNVSQVAYAVGFNNLSYFAKCFKEVYGSAPSKI
jgi:LPXTG-motif cell wall-anchored protein